MSLLIGKRGGAEFLKRKHAEGYVVVYIIYNIDTVIILLSSATSSRVGA